MSWLRPVLLTRLPPRLGLLWPPLALLWPLLPVCLLLGRLGRPCLCGRPLRFLRVHPAEVLGRPWVILIHTLFAVHGGLRHPPG